MPRSNALLCLFIFSSTFSVGAFPVLLPEIAGDGVISDVALGAIAGSFGLARLIADVPAGLYITHHLRRALVLAAACLLLGIACLAAGGPVWSLVLGRFFWGIGHALAMVGGITAIVRHSEFRRGGFFLNAFEMSGMCGVLCGMVVAGLLPRSWPWNISLAAAAAPQLIGVAVLPQLFASLPPDSSDTTRRPLFARLHTSLPSGRGGTRRGLGALSILAVSSGAAIALAWSAIGQFVLPLRASREFGLERAGVAAVVALAQIVDVGMLLPLGRIADRTSHTRTLGFVMIVLGFGVAAISLGDMYVALVGAVLLGIGMAAWMLPVSLINQGAPPGSVAWRTARYRLAVDAGIFLGPVLGGLLLAREWLDGAVLALAALLLVLGALLLRQECADS